MSNKIALVGNHLGMMVNFRGNLTNYLKSNGYQITIIAPFNDYNHLEDENIEVIDISLKRKGLNPFSDLKYLYRLYRIYKKCNFDIIFHYTIKPNIFGSIASSLTKTPSVAVVTGLGYTFIKQNIVSSIAAMLYKVAFEFASEVWFLNLFDKNIFIDKRLVDPNKAAILNGEGIDTDFFKPEKFDNDSGQISFLMISRALYDKGFLEYVEAAKIILRDNKNVKFQFLGSIDEGNPAAVSKETIEDYVKSGILEYLGTSTDVRSFIRCTDCIVLPSYREGLSRVLLEAASMSKPIIASSVPGCLEIVNDGINGLLCEAKDIEDLSNKLNNFINLSKKEKKIMGENGRKLISDKFDCKTINKFYMDKIGLLVN